MKFGYGKFILLTKHKTELNYIKEGYITGEYGVGEKNPLTLCAYNLPDKISYSQVVKLEKDIQNYYQQHKEELDARYREAMMEEYRSDDNNNLF